MEEVLQEKAVSEWKKLAETALHVVCQQFGSFIVDDVREELEGSLKALRAADLPVPSPADQRAIGAVLAVGVERGWCKGTDQYRRSRQAQCHGNPRRVWESLLCANADKGITELEVWKRLAFKFARHFNNADQMSAMAWSGHGIHLLAELQNLDPERYRRELKVKRRRGEETKCPK